MTAEDRTSSGDSAADAQARLDQIREEAGMPRRGDELARRAREAGGGEDASDYRDPPLDWRLTPRNVLLQLLAAGLFIAVVWFFVALLTDSWSALLGHYS